MGRVFFKINNAFPIFFRNFCMINGWNKIKFKYKLRRNFGELFFLSFSILTWSELFNKYKFLSRYIKYDSNHTRKRKSLITINGRIKEERRDGWKFLNYSWMKTAEKGEIEKNWEA